MATIIISGSRPSHGLTGSTRRHDCMRRSWANRPDSHGSSCLCRSRPSLARLSSKDGNERSSRRKLAGRNSLATPHAVSDFREPTWGTNQTSRRLAEESRRSAASRTQRTWTNIKFGASSSLAIPPPRQGGRGSCKLIAARNCRPLTPWRDTLAGARPSDDTFWRAS